MHDVDVTNLRSRNEENAVTQLNIQSRDFAPGDSLVLSGMPRDFGPSRLTIAEADHKDESIDIQDQKMETKNNKKILSEIS